MCWAQTATAILLVKHSEEVLAEKDLPDAWLHGLQANDFAAKSTSDKSLASVPEEPTIGGDAAWQARCWINPSREVFRQATRTGMITLSGRASTQGLMWTYVVINFAPPIGAALVS